ncbi:hypothetical protein IAT38_001468 [Cryptococcus sp. DSM 104549]
MAESIVIQEGTLTEHILHEGKFYPIESVMEDSDSDRPPSPASSSSSIQGDFAMDTDHAHFYHQQQQQAMLYQQHQQQNGLEPGAGKLALKEAQRHARMNPDADSDEYSDEESDSDSMPDDSIDFSLTYALHTFLATVEGQASVVKGDSLVLLDDANSYWWLVRVLKTEDVGYIPAENIETPYERLARLNKHRNVDLAAATQTEKQAGAVQSRERLKGAIAGKGRSARMDKSGDAGGSEESGGSRRVVFAPPTYVDHPGVTWSSDEESEGEEGMEVDGLDEDDGREGGEVGGVDQGLDDDMEPDDGVEWADDAAQGEQRRVADQRYQQQQQAQAQAQAQAAAPAAVQPKSNNPFARKSNLPVETISTGHGPGGSTTSLNSAGGSPILDPAAAGNDTRRITATPAVAGGSLMASANITGPNGPGGGSQPGSRNVSGQSTTSVYSTVSAASSASTGRSSTPNSGSPENAGGKMKKSRKAGEAGIGSGPVSGGSSGAGSVSSAEGGEKKKRGILGGLFSRKGKEKGKGVGGGDGRSSEDSTSMEDGRFSEDGPVGSSPSANGRGTPVGRRASSAPQAQTQAQVQAQGQGQGQQSDVSVHSMKLQQQDQARMQSYTSKYLSKSPSSELHSPNAAEAAAAVAQSAAAMRLAASMGMGGGVVGANGMIGEGAAGAGAGAGASGAGEGRARPSSIIMSPNPAGPPLLNVIRIFAGTDVQSESSFKTALINETTSAADLIRQATQRFHLPHVPGTAGTSSSAALVEAGYYVTVRDVNGEEMELAPDERPLAAFQAAVARWSDADDPTATDEHGQLLNARLGAITPTVKRSSVSSISSMVSLSSHPAIAKLGMNDYSDDSQVKIYLNRRGGKGGAGAGVWAGLQGAGTGQGQGRGMPETQSEFSSYSTGLSGLSTVQESSPDQSLDHSHANGHADASGDVESPSTPTQLSHSQAAAAAQAQRQDSSAQAPAAAPAQGQQRYNPSLTISTPGQSQAPPERYMSPSARFTLQLLIHASDLPDGVVFDPHSEGIVARGALRERQLNGPAGQAAAVDEGPRKRLFTLPRNANVVDAIEQGLERFGVQEGVVDGGDEVEDKVGKRRSMTRVRYRLAAVVGGQEKQLFPSSKVLDAYPAAPNFKPIEKSTPEQRRRSRDLSYHAGSTADILPSDPVFILRRVVPRGLSGARIDGQPQAQHQTQRQPAPAPITVISPPPSNPQTTSPDPRSPQEIIAAQRAASRANQLSLISSANTDKGVDVVLPQHQGTVRSVKQTGADGGQVVRYSYIDEGGETYDISDLLEEEWGADGAAADAGAGAGGKDEFGTSLVKRPGAGLVRMGTGSSEYVTAPSTPDETFTGLPSFASPSTTGRASTEPVEMLHDAQNGQPGDEQPRPSSRQRSEQDLLNRAVQRASQDGEAGLSEALSRVINRVKEGGKGSTSSEEVVRQQAERERGRVGSPDSEAGAGTRTPSGRTTPQQSQYQRTGSADPHATPRASNAHQYDQSRSHSRSNSRSGSQTPSQSPAASSHSRSNSRQNQHELQNTAASVNRIISRHRQQPSIASIMSDLETPAQASPGSRSRERSAPLDDVEGDDEAEGDDDGGFGDRSSTPATATSSTHPTPPFSGTASFTRALNVRSPTPGTPVSYRDDFGMKDMMAVIRMRAREFRPPHAAWKAGARPESVSNSGSSDRSRSSGGSGGSGDSVHTADTSPSEHAGAEGASVEVDRHLVGEKIEWREVHPDVRACFEGAQERLDRFDKEVDELLVAVGAMGA